MIMMAKGWKTGYLAESLQYGLMPDYYLAHVKQFTRWVSIDTLETGLGVTNYVNPESRRRSDGCSFQILSLKDAHRVTHGMAEAFGNDIRDIERPHAVSYCYRDDHYAILPL